MANSHYLFGKQSAKNAGRKPHTPKTSRVSIQQYNPTAESLNLQRAMVAPASTPPAAILALQQMTGNRAVQRLLKTHTLQAKLIVGPASDKYEQEADQMAGQVLRMPETVGNLHPSEEKETVAQRQPLADSVSRLAQMPNVQTRSDPQRALAGGFEAGSEIEGSLATHSGQGAPLPDSTRSFMEARFGSDFSRVRVHTGRKAVQLSRDLSAQAFTHGRDIFFGESKYNPHTGAGKQLLAHELTHVVQQGGALWRKPQKLALPKPALSSGSASIQRFVELNDFRTNTNKGALRRRGGLFGGMDAYLEQYKLFPQLVQNEADRKSRIRLLGRLKTIAENWVARHDVYDMFDRVQDTANDQVAETQGERDTARQAAITNPSKSRQGKYSKIIGYLEDTFVPAVDVEILSVTNVQSTEQIDGRLGVAPIKTPEQLALEAKQQKKLSKKRRENYAVYSKLKSKFNTKTVDTGKLFGNVIPAILSLMAPGPGDLGKFTVDIQIPLEGASVPWFVGGKIYLEGERKEANEYKSKFKASFKTGPKFAAASLYGEVGAQVEAQAQTPTEVSNLFNYALYRRFRESSFVPRGVTSYMWGGRKNTLGYQRSEKWAGEVEKDIFSTEDNAKKAYVDVGGYTGLGGGVEFGDNVKTTGAMERFKGRRYNKHTIETAKGGLGKSQFVKSGKQGSLGQGSRRYEFGGAISVSLGIGGSGDFKLKIDQVKAKTDPKIQGVQKQGYVGHYKTQKAELELNAMVNIPMGGSIVERILLPLGLKTASALRNIVQLVKKKDGRKGMVAGMGIDTLEETAGSFERNIEVNQIAQSGWLGNTGTLTSSGDPAAHSTVAALGKSAGTGAGIKMRLKITKEHELDLSASKWKLQGDLYSVNKIGASFSGNKIILDKSTRLGLLKWETGGKMKIEFLGFAGTRELNKGTNKMAWNYEKELKKAKKTGYDEIPSVGDKVEEMKGAHPNLMVRCL